MEELKKQIDTDFDDIRARAEGCGYEWTQISAPFARFALVLQPELQHLSGAYGGDPDNERDLQAALDLIEAEERRQHQQKIAEDQYNAAMPQEKFKQMGRDGKLEEGRGYLVRQDGGCVARVTIINNDVS